VQTDRKFWLAVAVLAAFVFGSENASAADLGQSAPIIEPLAPPSGWELSFTSYGWLTGVNGSATARGHSVDFDESFVDLVEKSNSILALMGYAEARKGRFALFTDAVWEDISFDAHHTSDVGKRAAGRPFEKFPNVNVAVQANLDISAQASMDYQATIIQSGAAYEVAKWSGTGSTTAFDVLAGARYWNEQTNLSLNVSGDLTADITGQAAINTADIVRLVLERRGLSSNSLRGKLVQRLIERRLGSQSQIVRRTLQVQLSRAFAGADTGDLEWVDPFVGSRIRHDFGENKNVTLEGDVGGFGAGSEFSWQVVGTYGFDVNVFGSTMHSVVGYRALAVDYSESGAHGKNGIDYVQHGPVIGAKFNW
jgi:hypothetical protein